MKLKSLTLCMFLALGASLTGCGDDSSTATTTKTDAGSDALPGDVTATTDTAGDTAGDTAATADAGTCGGLPSCLNAAGQADLGLCPQPSSKYACISGCCQVKFVCETDKDCADKNGVAPGCSDKRFTCGCDQDSGQCAQTMCTLDSQCGANQVCSQGGCIATPAKTSLRARLLRPMWVTAPNTSVDAVLGLGAQAVDDQGNVSTTATFAWQVGTTDAFVVENGTLKATGKPGKTTITATVQGSDKPASNVANLWNLGPIPADANLRVTVIDDQDWQTVGGKVVVIGLADAATPAAPQVVDLKDGQAVLKGVQFPADIHVVPSDHAPISVLRYDPAGAPGELLLPTPLRHFAQLEFDDQNKPIAANTKVIHGDAVRGEVEYPGTGEASLGITSLAFGSNLLNFSVDSILGPNVRRPFSPDAPAILGATPGQPQEIPGGVTFSLGKPVVTQYIVPGQTGKHTLWTLAGRLSLTDVITEVTKIVDAVDGGTDIGRIVSVLLPYLATFQSAVQYDVPFADTLSTPIKDLGLLKPSFPLLIKTEVEVGNLPAANGGWTDLVFVVGGALMPMGEIIPLGLSAGSDSAGGEDKPDGKVDGDSTEPGNQPLHLQVAPLHSGLQVGADNHVLIHAAVAIGGKGKKEGGSIVLGAPGPIAAATKAVEFMALPLGSAFDPATATLTVADVAAAQVYRVTLTGSEGRQWQVVVPKTLAGKAVKLPDLTSYGAQLQASEAKRALVGAFELRQALTAAQLLAPGGMTDLLRLVARTSFTDATP